MYKTQYVALGMTFRPLVTLIVAALLGSCACTNDWAYFPNTLPYKLSGVAPSAHLTESQAIELAVAVVIHHRMNPAYYAAPSAAYNQGEWLIYFGDQKGSIGRPLFGLHLRTRQHVFLLAWPLGRRGHA